ncbi:MAG: hypothetical protein IT391_07255 [Nitrospira sp.]|nr:hypothetical protein [Nitrospira sp.]
MGITTNHSFQTEMEFELPKGYVDEGGTLHRHGTMRLATAADEILPLRDPRVQQNEAYLVVIVLSRVITRLGTLADIHTGVIEGLYASDLAHLQRLYEKFNAEDVSAQELSREKALAAGGKTLRRVTAVGEA